MRDLLNCPNCGQPITADKCEYCGTVFYDFTTIDLNGSSYLRIKVNNHIYTVKAILTNFSVEQKPSSRYGYLDIYNQYVYGKPNWYIGLDFYVESDKNGVLFKSQELEESSE